MQIRFFNKIFLMIILLFVLLHGPVLQAQTQQALSAEEIEQYRKQAEQMVSFLQYNFNTLGDPEISVKEKDIIINQSFSKLFASEKVQIEDDLDENRSIPINKGVQAYLKDIDFFFKKVEFSFEIQNIEQQINQNNQLFFKITLNRNLNGETVDDELINTNRLRYIEINLNDEQKDLKIASIYTTKLNEKEELRKWWNELPLAWKETFGANIAIADTLRMTDVLYFDDSLAKLNYLVKRKMSRDTLTLCSTDSLEVIFSDTSAFTAALLDRQLKRIVLIDTLNISGNAAILNLEPLSRLSQLKRLRCSHVLASDLMPLRNLSHLEMLDCSFSPIESIEPLRYSTNIEFLNISGTHVEHIETVANFSKLTTFLMNETFVDSIEALSDLGNLKDLEISATQIKNLDALENLTGLERLDLSENAVNNLEPLKGLNNLYLLKLEKTRVRDLQPLKNLPNLQLLFIDSTPVYDLTPLEDLPALSRIYCDKTGITRQVANLFMQKKPGVLVIYESAELENWWKTLDENWKSVFAKYVTNLLEPSKEELHEISRITSVDVSGNKMINDLGPLSYLVMLKELQCQETGITSLNPLKNLLDLHYLDFSNTTVSGLTPLGKLTKLEELRFDNTLVASIEPIVDFTDLRFIYCDNSPTDVNEIVDFMDANPDCLVIYQTEELQAWWENFPEVWKLLTEKFTKNTGTLSREELQRIANLRKIDLSDFPDMADQSMKIESLDNINKLLFLRELKFNNTSVRNLEPLREIKTIEVLICPNNPIESLEPVGELRNLKELDIQNTPVKNLVFLAPLQDLKILRCSGTQIKTLKGVESLISLQQLDCFNTAIKTLEQIENLPNLKLVRCYNTKLTAKRISKFKSAHPNIEVVFY